MTLFEKDIKQINFDSEKRISNQASNINGFPQSWITSNSRNFTSKSSINTYRATQQQNYIQNDHQYIHEPRSPIFFNKMQANTDYSANQFPSNGRSISQGGRSISQGGVAINLYKTAQETKDITLNQRAHNEYDPRNRAPYGQASHTTRNPDQIEFKGKLAEALSQRSRSGSGWRNPKPNKSVAQKTNHKKSISNVFQSETKSHGSGSQQTKKTNLNFYVNDSVQKNFWVGASNPYSRQSLGQKSTQSPSGAETYFTSHYYGQAPLYTAKSLDNSAAHKRAQNSIYKNLISPINLKNLSSTKAYQSAERNKSSLFSSASQILNVPKTSPHNINPFLSGTPELGKFSSSPSRNSPASFRISADSRITTNRKGSVQDLLGQNLQKFEESMNLQKKADEGSKDNTLSPQNSYRTITPDSKNKFPSTHRPSFGGSVAGRASVDSSSQKSARLERSIYQVVVEHYTDSTKYEGEKSQGKRHGKGCFYYKEGYKFEGDWQDDEMNGFGILWLDQKTKIYEGEWQNNLFYGRGTLFNHEPKLNANFNGTDFKDLKSGWTKFEGMFVSGRKEGFGTLFLANGDVFVGSFARDVIHGRGSYTMKNGRKYIGLWRENILIQKF